MSIKDTSKRGVSTILRRVLGRRGYARLARYLWMQSRFDLGHDIRENGELLVIKALARNLAGNGQAAVLDVGANLGAWSELLLDELASTRTDRASGVSLHLFEPSPVTLPLLTANLSRWTSSARVVLNTVAVAETIRTSAFSVFVAHAGIHTLIPTPDDVPDRTVEVDVTTIDDYVATARLAKIEFVKVDTEGNDFNVLLGAKRSLSDGTIGCVQFEYNHRWIMFRRYLKDAFDLLLPLGFQLGKITPIGIERYSKWDPELESFREGNYIAWRDTTLPIDIIPWWNEA
jgi:FkbM family methyltransferase